MSDEQLLKQVAKDVADIKATLAAVIGAAAAALGVALGSTGPGAPGVASVASDADLDAKYGDPTVRKDPKEKYWKGESYVGRRFSECPAEYLEALAKYKDACVYANEKEGNPEKKKYAGYDRTDAARARGWAKRLREGWKPKGFNGAAQQQFTDDDYGDANADDIPF